MTTNRPTEIQNAAKCTKRPIQCYPNGGVSTAVATDVTEAGSWLSCFADALGFPGSDGVNLWTVQEMKIGSHPLVAQMRPGESAHPSSFLFSAHLDTFAEGGRLMTFPKRLESPRKLIVGSFTLSANSEPQSCSTSK